MSDCKINREANREMRDCLANKPWKQARELVKPLITKGADSQDESLLKNALKRDDREFIEWLYGESETNPDWENNYGADLGHLAVRYSAPECLEAWAAVASKKRLHAVTNTGSTKAHYAIYGFEQKGRNNALAKWVEFGGDVTIENNNGHSPLSLIERDEQDFDIKRNSTRKQLESFLKPKK